MNDIAERQNRESYLKLQYAARYYYNRAEIYNYIIWVICIVSTIVCNIKIEIPYIYIASLVIIITLVTVALQITTFHHVDTASAIRKYIDFHLFGFKLPHKYNNFDENDLLTRTENIVEKNKKAAQQQIRNNGTESPQGVRDWYSEIDSKDPRKVAVFMCQKQNVWWDKKLSQIYINILNIVLGLTIVIAVLLSLNNTVMELVCSVVPFLSLIVKVIWEIITVAKYKKLSVGLDTLLESPPNIPNEKYLMTIQEIIDKRRNLLFITPNLIHNLMSNRLHKVSCTSNNDF